jgi:hypothetical protein
MECPALPWLAVRKRLALESGRNVAVLNKTAPWAKDVWKREIAMRQQHEKKKQKFLAREKP